MTEKKDEEYTPLHRGLDYLCEHGAHFDEYAADALYDAVMDAAYASDWGTPEGDQKLTEALADLIRTLGFERVAEEVEGHIQFEIDQACHLRAALIAATMTYCRQCRGEEPAP